VRAMEHAIIIGAGPSGLTTAIALRAAGFAVSVFERAAEPGDTGSGLTLWPNAITALELIGAASAVLDVARPLAGFTMRLWRGDLLSQTAGELMLRRWHGSGVVLHRAELLCALGCVLGPGVVRAGARCTAFDSDGRGVAVRLADGSDVRGDLLIGA